MRSKGIFFALAAILAVAFLVFPVVATAAGMTNADCLGCHTSVRPQNFTVGPVNRDTACKKCHADSFVGAHPNHNATANCGAVCHPGMGASLASAIPSVLATGGAFATAISQDTSPALLHIIHANPRWEAKTIKGGNDCGRCHATSACTACHDDVAVPVASVHANHSSTSPTSTPWVGDVSYGLPTGKVTGAVVRCGAPTCHNTAGVAAAKPGLLENYNSSANPAADFLATTVSYAGTWRTTYGAAYSRGQQSIGISPGAELSTTFTGQRVYLISDKDRYRGIAEVFLDNVSQGTIDLYNPVTKTQTVVWKSESLATGAHTIKVRVTGSQNPNARAAYVAVDQFKVYAGVPASIAPNCTDACHPDKASGHGSYTWPHEATQTAGNSYNGGTGNYRCDSCHSMVFLTEHGRTSSLSAGQGCSLCHLTYAPQSITGTWVATDGCNYSQCHASATPRQPHTAIAASHTASTETTQQPCRDCHAGDLGAIHNNSITTNAYTTNCNTCHTPASYPASKSCSAQGCHDASGVRLVDDHTINATFNTRHTASSMTSTTQSPGPDGAIYTATKDCSACHSAKLTTAHATTSIGAIGCTSGGTGNTGCHFNTSLNTMSIAKTGWTTDKCAECHDYGTARTHDATVTAHSVAAGTCAGTVGCHNYTDLAVLHSVSQSGGAAKYNSCTNNDTGDPTGCHNTLDKRPTRWASDTASCGQGTTGCHTDKTTANHGKKHLLDLTGSNYVNATQSGCTNSGAGCHGSSTSTDVADYHPTGSVTCLSSGCHTSTDKATHHQPFICTDCHDSTYSGAIDTTGLADSYPLGHYSETTHTVGSMMTTISAGGTYSAACLDCHSPVNVSGVDGLYFQHQGLQVLGSTSCSDCHNANASIQMITTDAVRTNTCDACHTGSVLPTMVQHGSAPVVSGTEAGGAGTCVKAGCHTTTDLHALHKSNTNTVENGCTMAGCHDSTKQGWKPTSTSCGTGGTCHTGSLHNPTAHVTLASNECVVCHESADLQVVHLNNCSLCHGNPSYPTLPTGKLECTSCHALGVVGTKTYSPIEPNHYNGTETSHTASTAQSATVDADTEGYSCGFCHKMEMKPEHITKTSSAFTTATAVTDKCIVCHENYVDPLGTYPVWNKTCTACHAVKHTQRAAKHDASAVSPGCASTGSSGPATLTAENFDGVTAPAWPSSWVESGTDIAQLVTSSSSASSTPNSAMFASDSATARSAYFYKTVDTSALNSPALSFAYSTNFPTNAGASTLYPSGLSSAGGWTCTDWVNYLDDNESVNYASDGTSNDVFLVGMDDPISTAGTVTSVEVHAVAWSTANSSRDNIAIAVNGVGNLYGTTTGGITKTTPTDYSSGVLTTNPSTGLAWTWSDITNMTAGVKHIINGTIETIYVTQVYAVVNTSNAPTASNDYLKAEYSTNGGTSWTSLLNATTTTGWTTVTSAVPQSSSLMVRFSAASDATNRVSYVDDIALTYTQTGSTCHNVSNVAAIHNNSAPVVTSADTLRCAVCHKSNDAVPTILNCTDSSCHGTSSHTAVHISTRVECTNCHGSTDIRIIHAGKGDGCNVCHGGGGYSNVATGKTSDCVNCHNATGSGTQKTYSPITTGLYVGNEASHTAGAAQGSSTLNWAGNPTCTTCHGLELYPEHNRVTASKTTTSTNTCENCHLSTVFANPRTVIAGKWADRNTASACIACHAVDTATNQHGQTAITGNHTITGDTQSCASSGSGCHPVSNVAQVGTQTTTANIHLVCASCHGTSSRAGLVTPGALAQGCTGNTNCHATGYATNNHNSMTGSEAIHTADAASMATTVGAYTYYNACTNCHSTALALAHNETSTTAVLDSGNTGWNSTAQSICRDCHNAAATSKTVASAGVVKANWSTKTCAECHTATLHSSFTNHSVTAGSGCTLSNGCHGYTGSTLDVRAVHDKSTSGCTANGTDNKGWSGGCQKVDKAMTTTSMSCGMGATGQACHTGHTNTNHGPDHTYTTASDYAESTSDTIGGEAGCPNSGTGCHGVSGALRDAIVDYHPAGAVSCLSSACHTSPTMTAAWKTGGTGADCSRCHAGNFTNAKSNMPLYQAASAGHYNETTHTVTGMSTSVSAGGTASAVCSVCHSVKLRDAHGAVGGPLVTTTKGSYLTCQECHGYNAAVSAVVTDTVHSNTCSTCHASGVLGATHVVHATTAPVATVGNGTGCASSGIGCHSTSDLHVIHKDAAGCALAGCHDALNKSLTAASTSCGQSTGCHTSAKYTSATHNGTHGLINGADTTHTAGTTQMNDTYSYNSKSTACSACHASTLLTEHSRSTSSLTGAGATVCLQCHNDSTTVANIVTTSWPNQNTTSACSSCHANTDATSAATLHGNISSAHTATAVTGCTGLGAGCHGTSTTPDLTTVHTTGCALNRACHSTTVYNPGQKTCISSTCHASADFNTTTYAHNISTSNITGSDATHTVTSGMTTTVGAGGTATAACSVCHSTTLKNAHDVTKATASIISTVTGVTSWSNECTGCHNTTAPVNVSTVVAAGTWPHSCVGSNCHTTGQDIHVDGGASDAPATLGNTTVSPACNNTGCHATMDLHVLHKNAASGCGLTDVNGSGCHNAANVDKLPTQTTCGGTGGAGGPCHQGYASGTHGVSSGGKLCSQCHGSGSTERLDKMNNDTSTYHHVLDYNSGGSVWDVAPNSSTYPVDENAMACVSCHSDHNYFNSNPGANLRTSINAASVSVTNTDFIGGNGASGNYDDGICLSCHYASKTKSTTGQLATGSGMSTVTPAISALDYNNSSHNYSYSAQFTKNSSAFRANCSKCHDDATDATKTLQNGTYKIATHFSAESRIAQALGVTLPSANSEENLCYGCHSGGLAAGNDTYGAAAMSAKARGIQLEFAKTYTHNVATYAGIHRSDEYNAAPSSVAPGAATGWWGTSNAKRHVECEDCHDPHAVANARTPLSASNVRAANTAVPVSGAEKSVWGVDISGSASGLWAATGTTGTPVQPTYNKIASSVYEWQLCLKCHSTYAWGNTPVNGESANLGGLASTSATMTDVGRDFSTTMYAYHPLFKAGRNQPAVGLNANWDSSTNRRLISGSNTGNGLSNTLTDGWLAKSIVTCTDCHGSDNAAGPEGAHGSSQRWMLKTADPNVVVTIANGTATTPNSGNTETGNYCINCHRRDVYTNGSEAAQTNASFSRFSHPANTSCMDRTKSVVGLAGCMNCHGGRKDNGSWTASQNGQAGAIHGSNVTWYSGSGTTAYAATQAFTTNPESERFCNGAAWTSHGLGDASGSIGCQTLQASDSYSTCSAHGTSTKTKAVTPNYYYTYGQ